MILILVVRVWLPLALVSSSSPVASPAPNNATIHGRRGNDHTWQPVLPLTGGTLSGGLSFGSAIATAPENVSRHLALYGTQHGISITSGQNNYVANTGNTHAFYGGTVQQARITAADGITTPIDGRPLTGAQAVAGEWGHNPLPHPTDGERPGPRCYCGRIGCIETWLSGPRFERQYLDQTGQTLRATEIGAAALAGDAAAAAQLELYCDRLARALSVVINIVDPHAIVLGGGLSRMTQLYDRVPELWKRYVFSEPELIVTRLLPPRFGDSSGVRGAAWLWPE